MSLVYNALREQAPALPARLPVRRLQRPAILLLAALVAVPAGYAGARLLVPAASQHSAPVMPDGVMAMPVQALPAQAVASVQARTPTPAPAAVPRTDPATTAAPPVVALPDTSAPAMPVAATALVAAPAPVAATASVAQAAPASMPMRPAGQLQVSQRQADSDAVAPLQAQLQQAIAEGRLEHAQALLDSLAGQLPADSLTLLRAQAWLAHARGDQAMALQAYRRIVERVPDDAHAGANLALLLAAAGQTEQAHATLARLSVQQADNPLLRRARAALEATAP